MQGRRQLVYVGLAGIPVAVASLGVLQTLVYFASLGFLARTTISFLIGATFASLLATAARERSGSARRTRPQQTAAQGV